MEGNAVVSVNIQPAIAFKGILANGNDRALPSKYSVMQVLPRKSTMNIG